MLENFQYRLALSATIDRHGDEEGTQKLYNYFGEKCIEYSLSDAIRNNMLTPYKYFPVVVSLNEVEREEYLNLTAKIRKGVHRDKYGKIKLTEAAKMLLIKRARLVSGAEEKISALRDAIQDFKNDNQILVYCGATTLRDVDYHEGELIEEEIRQIDAVVKMLGFELNMRVSKFTSQENSVEREMLKKNFEEGNHLQALVAIRCLDEGVNIPSIRTAFILASSTNPKEYVQRRGRVLRKFPGKNYATIFDFITLPIPLEEVDNFDSEIVDGLKSLAKRELSRLKTFAADAENPFESDELAFEIQDTFGKTTLLQAFNWCLYGTVNFPNNDKNLLNYEISTQMQNGEQETVEVEITLLHGNTEYIITRTQRYNFVGGKPIGEAVPKVTMSHLQEDGQTKPIQENKIKEVINNILPEGLSTYFFFDTERISTVSNRKDIGKAVKDFLGLSVLENALRHLGDRTKKSTVIGRIYGEMDLEGNNRAQDALDRMQTAREKRDYFAEQIENCKNQTEHYEERKAEVEKILRDNQSTAQLQKDKEKLERQIKTEEKILEQSIESYFKEFNSGALQFFVQPLIARADKFLKEVKIDEKGVSDITKNSIMELIKRGRCICGREICEGNEAFENLMAEIKFVPPESIGVTVKNYRQMLKNFSRSFDRIYDRLNEIHDNIEHSKSRIHDWSYELDDFSKKIFGKENMSKFENELKDIKNRLEDFREKKEDLIQKIGALENEIKHYQKLYDALIASSEKNREVQEFLNYAEELKAWLEPTCKNNERKIRKSLESEVNKIFDQMYSGKRRVEIDDQYRVELIATVADTEIVSGESEGANRVKNFAFIAGLVALAKQQILKKESGISSESYPLVMDAPFSNADEKHTTSISKVLPEIAEQIIMFVMKKDWNYAERVMNHRVGKKYLLNKISETFTNIKEA